MRVFLGTAPPLSLRVFTTQRGPGFSKNKQVNTTTKHTPGPWTLASGHDQNAEALQEAERVMCSRRNYAARTEHNGVSMRLIGYWSDLAAYYEGSDGNAWCWNACAHSWANEGPLRPFYDAFPTRHRGELDPQATQTQYDATVNQALHGPDL